MADSDTEQQGMVDVTITTVDTNSNTITSSYRLTKKNCDTVQDVANMYNEAMETPPNRQSLAASHPLSSTAVSQKNSTVSADSTTTPPTIHNYENRPTPEVTNKVDPEWVSPKAVQVAKIRNPYKTNSSVDSPSTSTTNITTTGEPVYTPDFEEAKRKRSAPFGQIKQQPFDPAWDCPDDTILLSVIRNPYDATKDTNSLVDTQSTPTSNIATTGRTVYAPHSEEAKKKRDALFGDLKKPKITPHSPALYVKRKHEMNSYGKQKKAHAVQQSLHQYYEPSPDGKKTTKDKVAYVYLYAIPDPTKQHGRIYVIFASLDKFVRNMTDRPRAMPWQGHINKFNESIDYRCFLSMPHGVASNMKLGSHVIGHELKARDTEPWTCFVTQVYNDELADDALKSFCQKLNDNDNQVSKQYSKGVHFEPTGSYTGNHLQNFLMMEDVNKFLVKTVGYANLSTQLSDPLGPPLDFMEFYYGSYYDRDDDNTLISICTSLEVINQWNLVENTE